MKRIYHLLLLVCTVWLVACNDHIPDPTPMKAERTVIVYMMAENSLNDFVRSDSAEMAYAVQRIPDNVNFVLYKDDIHLPVIYALSRKNGVQKWKQFTKDQVSTDSLTMRNTLRDIVATFSADHYGLVLWSHGGGWVPQARSARKSWIGIDNNKNSLTNTGWQMNISELRWTLEQLPHFDYVLFDACFMQSIEVAYELRKVTDYMIGSPAEIPGTGAPYDQIMTELCKSDIAGIVNNYHNAYVSRSGVALSAINCKKLEALANATRSYGQHIWSDTHTKDTKDIQRYGPFYSGNSYSPEPFDLRGCMYHFLPEEDYKQWDKYLSDALVECKTTNSWETIYRIDDDHNRLTDEEHYSGISTFVPNPKYNPYGWNETFRRTEWYKATGWGNTEW